MSRPGLEAWVWVGESLSPLLAIGPCHSRWENQKGREGRCSPRAPAPPGFSDSNPRGGPGGGGRGGSGIPEPDVPEPEPARRRDGCSWPECSACVAQGELEMQTSGRSSGLAAS